MQTNIKKIILAITLAATSSFIIPQAVAAATATTISGVVHDKNGSPIAGATVVAWCGGVNFFGGSGVTDSHGHYLIKTDTDKCPLGTELTVTTDVNNDGLSDGATTAQTYTNTSTIINIRLGSYTSVTVPEYGWISAAIATATGLGILGFVRRSKVRE